jgi:hypothetical protein
MGRNHGLGQDSKIWGVESRCAARYGGGTSVLRSHELCNLWK